jgi:hypothetical protein
MTTRFKCLDSSFHGLVGVVLTCFMLTSLASLWA